MKNFLNNLFVKLFRKNKKRTLLVDVSKPIDLEYLSSIKKDWKIIINPRCEIPDDFNIEEFYNVVCNPEDDLPARIDYIGPPTGILEPVSNIPEFFNHEEIRKQEFGIGASNRGWSKNTLIRFSRNREPIKDSIKVGKCIESAKYDLPDEYLNKK